MTPRYITLMASLPPLGKLFQVSQEPISLLKLESRLRSLSESDQALLGRVSNLMAWADQPVGRSDLEFIQEAENFFRDIDNPILRHLVTERLNIRTIVAALRRRHRGEQEGPADQPWGWGEWVRFIENHWKQHAFGLERIHPWVDQAATLLEANDLVGFERLQFDVVWKILDRIGFGHYFDFEALVIYLNRWSLVARWSCYKEEAAKERFRQLVSHGLGSFADGPSVASA